ncbi:hypothetical protein Catovirus_2_312 [Catovirus CTV1]|uniref:Uncharacterized protein n=1 Tax=Catovirus CTV1 TaxID=1977631 RepID=A0A1V0SCC0_9VIRU|nr:hypothetical protein Catovirus_2_312 [Catovirus CTV1]
MNIEGENFSPEDLASFIFEELPNDPCSIKFLPYSVNMDKDETSFLFEILITIYMEGMMHGHRLYDMLRLKKSISSDPESPRQKINVYDLNKQKLELCEDWIKSLGFLTFVEEYKASEYIFDQNEYCKILLADNPYDSKILKNKGVNKPYHFIIYAGYNPTNLLENMKAVFCKPKDPKKKPNDYDKIYTIKFKKLNK